ncbi:MAG: hypothetical protein AAGA80_16710 [Cyanobacteria bacterium P01_F01_bin.143]
MIFPTKIRQKILTTTAIVAMACPLGFANAQAQSLKETNGRLIAQGLGKIQTTIELSEVPQTVLTAVNSVSGAEPTYAQVEINPDGSFVYELGGQNQQGFNFEMDVKPNGEIIEVDEEIDASAVPAEVMKIFKYWLPDVEIVSTWRSTRYSSFDYYYEIVIGEDFWVEIPANGKTLKISPLQ